jgi:hypothetical protein
MYITYNCKHTLLQGTIANFYDAKNTCIAKMRRKRQNISTSGDGRGVAICLLWPGVLI